MPGKELTFGIRPEHLTEAKTNGSKNLATFDAGIEVVEPMGNETMVFFAIKRHGSVRRAPIRTPAPRSAPR